MTKVNVSATVGMSATVGEMSATVGDGGGQVSVHGGLTPGKEIHLCSNLDIKWTWTLTCHCSWNHQSTQTSAAGLRPDRNTHPREHLLVTWYYPLSLQAQPLPTLMAQRLFCTLQQSLAHRNGWLESCSRWPTIQRMKVENGIFSCVGLYYPNVFIGFISS